MSLCLTWRCYNLHHSVRKISDHTLITFTLLPPFQNKTLTQSDQVTCLGVLQVQTKSKCLEQARATQHRHLRLPWAPRAAPKSVRVSFCPATCAAAGRADQLQAQVGGRSRVCLHLHIHRTNPPIHTQTRFHVTNTHHSVGKKTLLFLTNFK